MPKQAIIFDVPVRLKSESKLMKFIAFILSPFNKTFMTHYWTTIGGVVYAPSYFDNLIDGYPFELEPYKTVLAHEKKHADDQSAYGIFFYLTYLLPPVMFAYGRWYWERKAYLPELVDLYQQPTSGYEDRLERIVNTLGGPDYLWTWPKERIRKWFTKTVKMKLAN